VAAWGSLQGYSRSAAINGKGRAMMNRLSFTLLSMEACFKGQKGLGPVQMGAIGAPRRLHGVIRASGEP
jgi:hypothetical protein